MPETVPATAYKDQGLRKRILRRHGQYKERRSLYDAQRDVIVEHVRPDLCKGGVGAKSEGLFEHTAIVEGTAPHAAQVWQRGFQANMVSRKQEWFRDKLAEPDPATGVTFEGNDEVNRYLQDFTDHMVDAYRRSNYYDVMPNFVDDGGTVGTPVMLFQEALMEQSVICQVPDYAACWIDKDIFGRDNCLHVLWEWDAIQAASFFGEEELPDVVKRQLENGNYYDKTQYLQVIYAAGDPIYNGLPKGEAVAQTHPWLEHFICMHTDLDSDDKILEPKYRGSGYFVRPWATWHYHRNWNEVYSRTMAWFAIYDIRGANAMWQALFGEAERAIDPPSWAWAIHQGVLDLGPGGRNWAATLQELDAPPTFIEKSNRYEAGMDFAERLLRAVRRWFHYDAMMPISQIMENKNQPETAYGLMKADLERVQQLAPQVETYERQVLGHAHDVFIECERRAAPAYPWGRLPKPPDIVLEYARGTADQITPEFIGLLSMAQRRDRRALKWFRALGMAEYAMQFDENARLKVRWPQAVEDMLEAEDFPQDLIRSDEEFEQVTQALQQRQLQAELAEQAPKMAQAAKALGAKTEKGSPLALLTGAK